MRKAISFRTWLMRTSSSRAMESRDLGKKNLSVRILHSVRWFIRVKIYCLGNALIFYLAGHDVMTLWSIQMALDLTSTPGIWVHHLFRLEHARGASRRARSIIPTHSRYSPGQPPPGKCIKRTSLEIPGLITFLDLWRHPET